MDYVKHKMSHGDLSIQAYNQVWEECYSQVKLPTYSLLQGSGKLIDTMANVSIFGGNFFIM